MNNALKANIHISVEAPSSCNCIKHLKTREKNQKKGTERDNRVVVVRMCESDGGCELVADDTCSAVKGRQRNDGHGWAKSNRGNSRLQVSTWAVLKQLVIEAGEVLQQKEGERE